MAPMYRKGDHTINVSGTEIEEQYAGSGYDLVEPEPERAYPEGDPTSQWTVDELKRWASEHKVEVPAGAKPVVIETVLTALATIKASATPPGGEQGAESLASPADGEVAPPEE